MMRTAQVATALLVATLTFSGLHAAFGHRWYGWHQRHGHYHRNNGRHYGHCYDRGSETENSKQDTTYRLP